VLASAPGRDVASARAAGLTLNPIAAENRATPSNTWSNQFRLSSYTDMVLGFATKSSVNVGEKIDLKLISYDPAATSATLELWRLGWYGGAGGRLVRSQTVNPLPRFEDQGDATGSALFGLRECSAWPVITTIPAGITTVSGMYLVKVRANNGRDTHVPIVVRDDGRARDVLVALPTNTWQAYNNWDTKSLYNYNSTAAATVAGVWNGHSRAVKVSFDRPLRNVLADPNWVLRTEFPLIWFLEQQGYDVAYTDDYGLHSQPTQLRRPRTKTLAIAGHSEYWSAEAFDNVKAARDAGTNIASFSANTCYWQVRYEPPEGQPGGDPSRTLVCFKTVQGVDIASPDAGALGCNDFGPGASARGGSGDCLGDDGNAETADDRPRNATTTFRDFGAPQGNANAPDDATLGRGRVGPGRPENELFGVMYVGDDDAFDYPLQVPGGSGSGGEFGGHPAWRHTTLANRQGAQIGTNLVGWEWDAIPLGGAYGAFGPAQPASVKRLAETDIASFNQPGNDVLYLRDAGRVYSAAPDPGQGSKVHAVTYRAPSGAHVFASGTIQWSFGLGPHFESDPQATYELNHGPVDSSQAVIRQATANILADGGVRPTTPEGIVLDSGTVAPPTTGPPSSTPRDSTPPKLRIGRRRQVLGRRRAVRVRLRCPVAERQGVFGTVELFLVLPRGRRGRRKKRLVRIGKRSFRLRSGQAKTIAVRMPRSRRRMLRRLGRARVQVRVRVSDQNGNTARLRSAFKLYAKQPSPRG
jgi:hypothetical protein